MVYYSVRSREALRMQLVDLPLGFAHYSYGIVCKRFVDVMTVAGANPIELPMPEIFPSYRYVDPEESTRPVHFIFKPFDEIRVLKEAYNIVHVAWEYTRLPSFKRMPKYHKKTTHPLNDYVHALRLVDEIWVGCTFTKNVLNAEGFENVHIIPAPVSGLVTNRQKNLSRRMVMMNSLLQMTDCSSNNIQSIYRQDPALVPGETLFLRMAERKQRNGKVFISILNPHDPRKNAGELIAGFQSFCEQTESNDLLVIKVLVDGKFNSLRDAVRGPLSSSFSEAVGHIDMLDSKNILLFAGYMTGAELERFYDLADFYLCASNAEGQNMPILEAMARGVTPVSGVHTAMLDYMSPTIGVIINSKPAPVHSVIAETYGLYDAEWHDVDSADITRSLHEAVALDQATLEDMRRNAISALVRGYAAPAVEALINERLSVVRQICGT